MSTKSFFYLFVVFLLASCQKPHFLTPTGKKVRVKFAVSPKDQVKGLSGTRPEKFGEDEAMLFLNKSNGPRSFWMPDTYFNLDIFFLDEKFKILDVERNVQHYIGRDNPKMIPRTRTVWANHILEMKASSPLSKSLEIGMTLKISDLPEGF